MLFLFLALRHDIRKLSTICRRPPSCSSYRLRSPPPLFCWVSVIFPSSPRFVFLLHKIVKSTVSKLLLVFSVPDLPAFTLAAQMAAIKPSFPPQNFFDRPSASILLSLCIVGMPSDVGTPLYSPLLSGATESLCVDSSPCGPPSATPESPLFVLSPLNPSLGLSTFSASPLDLPTPPAGPRHRARSPVRGGLVAPENRHFGVMNFPFEFYFIPRFDLFPTPGARVPFDVDPLFFPPF